MVPVDEKADAPAPVPPPLFEVKPRGGGGEDVVVLDVFHRGQEFARETVLEHHKVYAGLHELAPALAGILAAAYQAGIDSVPVKGVAPMPKGKGA